MSELSLAPLLCFLNLRFGHAIEPISYVDDVNVVCQSVSTLAKVSAVAREFLSGFPAGTL